MNLHPTLVIAFSWLLPFVLGACGNGGAPLAHTGVCGNYTAHSSSPYVLPVASGATARVSQGNCSGTSHFGVSRYAYDFSMDIGTSIVAVRAGTVISLEESFADGNGCPNDNNVSIMHSDGTVAEYVHLTQNGVLVAVGDSVTQGQSIALSGNTGCSTGPHLHFQVWRDRAETDTVPVTFSNTSAHPAGLESSTDYLAN